LGGMAMRGALITGLAGLVLYAHLRGLPLGQLADASALGLAIGQAIGWIGALSRGANYGVASDSRFAVELPDIYGLNAPRFPYQHFEIGLFLLLFVGLGYLALRRQEPGILFLTYWLTSSVANLVLEIWRGDSTIFIGALRADQVTDLAFCLCAFGFIAWRAVRPWNPIELKING
jgi:prolipoprotein diacylglyceryltransferase